mmetsp:Transcript_4876/g.12974  ORF Transcript_4876/g.12974 Transcript_4876/m.12974 type:complete len:537 (-) Transcript_4876:19-1629(-)
MGHAVEETDDAGPAAGDAEFAVRGVDARGRGHGHAEVVRACGRRYGPRRDDAVGLHCLEKLLGDLPPRQGHGVEVLRLRVGFREEILRHKGHRIGAAAHPRRAGGFVDVDDNGPQPHEIQPARSQHPGRAGVGARTRVPELLRRVRQPVRLRPLQQNLPSPGDGIPQHVADVGAGREVRVVDHVLVVEVEDVLPLVLSLDEVQHVLLNLGIFLGLLVQCLLGDAEVLECAVVVEHVRLQPSLCFSEVVEEVIHPEALPLGLGGVHWAHAHEGRLVRRLPTVHQIEQLVVRPDDVHVADKQSVLVVDLVAGQLRNLLQHEGDWVHDALRPDGVHLARRQHAAGAQVEGILGAVRPDDRVACVLAAVHTSDHLDVRVDSDGVYGLALAFVAEETSGDHQDIRPPDQRLEYGLLGGLHVLPRRCVAQLRDGFQVFQLLEEGRANLHQLSTILGTKEEPLGTGGGCVGFRARPLLRRRRAALPRRLHRRAQVLQVRNDNLQGLPPLRRQHRTRTQRAGATRTAEAGGARGWARGPSTGTN